MALVLVLAVRAKHRRSTGALRRVACDSRAWRNTASPLLAAVLVIALSAGIPHPSLVVTLMVASAACLWLRPHPGDEIYGELGVQRGWRSRRFEELEEWRLTGDHLRFRIGDAWLAVGLPSDQHASARELLVERCGERESRFDR